MPDLDYSNIPDRFLDDGTPIPFRLVGALTTEDIQTMIAAGQPIDDIRGPA